MLFKIVTDFVSPHLSSVRPDGMTISYIDGLFVITSHYFPSFSHCPADVIASMGLFCQLYCGRIITATFINDGVTSYGHR